MSSAAEQEIEQEIFQLIADTRTTNELAVAGLTIVLLEHIATFPDEINLVWQSRFSPSSVFYVGPSLRSHDTGFYDCSKIWIRYLPLIALSIDISFMLKAEGSDRGEMAISTIFHISADIILVLRVWILYGRSRPLLYFWVVPLIAAETIAMFVVGVYTIKPLDEYIHIGPVIGGCYSLEVPRLFTYYALPPFILSCIMFSMTLYKCAATLMAMGPRRTPVTALFLRDGLFYFLALMLVGVVEIILWAKARPTLAQIPVIPGTAGIVVISARVLLNIKRVASPTGMAEALTLAGSTTMDTEIEHIHLPVRRGPAERVPWYLKTETTGDGEHTLT
ncbi:hypothetical protein B0H16DRAFT_1853782 [Mycena metata]|uniref:DUF6533 domain-containing protein n=1 Tax=Mycena metata TaxID=1033252 RepID=A0AAD7NVZ4_9AGAR|nr:hypothetical protein B0H16DRAFT_1853782 [Mycena metata]